MRRIPQSGDLPYTAPNYPDQGGGGPMWSGFVVTMPWQVYLNYGDKGILETNYPMIRKWLAFADSKTKDNILEPYISIGMSMPQWNYLGDWVTPQPSGTGGRQSTPRETPSARVSSTTRTTSTPCKWPPRSRPSWASPPMPRCIRKGRPRCAARCTNAISSPPPATPPASSPTWRWRCCSESFRRSCARPCAKNLEDTILVKDSGHFNSGMHGTYFLLKELMEDDRNDLIYQMASKKDFPSWGYMLEQGATTSWESWSAGSHIHDTLISIGAWFIEGIGGIRADEKAPGFRHFFLKPTPVGGLTFARTSYKSVHGTIVSNWRIENGALHMDATVPPGTERHAVPARQRARGGDRKRTPGGPGPGSPSSAGWRKARRCSNWHPAVINSFRNYRNRAHSERGC